MDKHMDQMDKTKKTDGPIDGPTDGPMEWIKQTILLCSTQLRPSG